MTAWSESDMEKDEFMHLGKDSSNRLIFVLKIGKHQCWTSYSLKGFSLPSFYLYWGLIIRGFIFQIHPELLIQIDRNIGDRSVSCFLKMADSSEWFSVGQFQYVAKMDKCCQLL